jgi:2-C-methyl-D-erythritol 2,4-cyclodiphosphate synthase
MMRIGHGYDVHRLVPERRLIIGGVEIPYELGLLGHSDADVLLHALCDAILGAIGAGDIGKHFPDSDPAYKGIDSLKLLDHVVALAREQGYAVGNCDATVIAQRPKLAPYIAQMIVKIAEHCGVDEAQVNVKATTTENLGFEGRGEGISAHSVVLMKKLD